MTSYPQHTVQRDGVTYLNASYNLRPGIVAVKFDALVNYGALVELGASPHHCWMTFAEIVEQFGSAELDRIHPALEASEHGAGWTLTYDHNGANCVND